MELVWSQFGVSVEPASSQRRVCVESVSSLCGASGEGIQTSLDICCLLC